MPRVKLTDKQKQKIVADYVDNQNYCETARMNNVTETTARRIIKGNSEIVQKVEEKKQENTKKMLDMLDETNNTRMEAIGDLLKAINNKAKNSNDMFTNVKDLASA